MSWLKKVIKGIQTVVKSTTHVPKGTWVQCHACKNALFRAAFEENFSVCSCCGYHHRIRARKRLKQLLDPGTGQELAQIIETIDRLKFKDQHKYKERLDKAKRETGEKEALLVMQGQLEGIPVVCAVFEFGFMGGSMGTAVGARFVQAVEKSLELNCPLICVAASGGARMQEGLFSLIQMAKTSAALGKLKQAGLPFISILTDPTMGGVSASLGSLGDIIIAEPKALIGFAGPRVIEQTVHQILPDGFQYSEFLLAHGAIDMIVERKDLKLKLARLLRKLMYTNQTSYALSVKSSCDYPYSSF